MIGQRANFTTGPDWLGIHKIPVKPSGLTPFEYTLHSRIYIPHLSSLDGATFVCLRFKILDMIRH